MPTQFLRKPFKTVCIDTVLFFAMFALVGHITINYWERYTIQNELFSMKHSLHTLKDNLGNIGKAYDILHIQLKGVIQEINKKQVDTPQCRKKEKLEAKCKAEYNLNKNRDFQVQTATTKSNKMVLMDALVGTDNNKEIIHGHEHKATGPKGTNASTNTKNPPKSTGTTPLDIPYDKDYRRTDLDSQRSDPDHRHNDYDYRHHDHDHRHKDHDYRHHDHDYRHNDQDYRHNDQDYRHFEKDHQHSKTRYKDYNDYCTHVCHGMTDRHEKN